MAIASATPLGSFHCWATCSPSKVWSKPRCTCSNSTSVFPAPSRPNDFDKRAVDVLIFEDDSPSRGEARPGTRPRNGQARMRLGNHPCAHAHGDQVPPKLLSVVRSDRRVILKHAADAGGQDKIADLLDAEVSDGLLQIGDLGAQIA